MSTPFRTNISFASRLKQTPAQKQPKSTAAAQFQSWVSEKEKLLREASDADRAREDLEKKLKESRQQQVDTNEKIQHASNQLGGFHRQRELLAAEKAGLQKKLANERVELEERAKAIEDARKEEREKKQTFCKEITELSRELGVLLREQQEDRLKKLIDAETADIIVAHHRKASDPTDSPESVKDDARLFREMEAAAVMLREKTILHKQALAKHTRLRSARGDARSRALKLGQANAPSASTKVSRFRTDKGHGLQSLVAT